MTEQLSELEGSVMFSEEAEERSAAMELRVKLGQLYRMSAMPLVGKAVWQDCLDLVDEIEKAPAIKQTL